MFCFFAIFYRYEVTKNIIQIPHKFSTEFRDDDAYKIRKELIKLQTRYE